MHATQEFIASLTDRQLVVLLISMFERVLKLADDDQDCMYPSGDEMAYADIVDLARIEIAQRTLAKIACSQAQ